MSCELIKLKLKNLVIITVVTFGRKKNKKKRIVLWDRFAAIITPQDRGHRDEKLKGTTKKLKKHQHNA